MTALEPLSEALPIVCITKSIWPGSRAMACFRKIYVTPAHGTGSCRHNGIKWNRMSTLPNTLVVCRVIEYRCVRVSGREGWPR